MAAVDTAVVAQALCEVAGVEPLREIADALLDASARATFEGRPDADALYELALDVGVRADARGFY